MFKIKQIIFTIGKRLMSFAFLVIYFCFGMEVIITIENNSINNTFIDKNIREIIKRFTTFHSSLFFNTQKAQSS